MVGCKLSIRLAAIALLAGLAGACGTANDSAPTVDPVRGKHPSTWAYDHRAYYHDNQSQCFDCHGSDLKGGITRIDCFNQAADARCHADNHAPRPITPDHVANFRTPTLHGPVARQNLRSCQACHGQPGISGTNPRYNLPIGSLPNGCETCHPIRAGHPAPWANHRLATIETVSGTEKISMCDICHGISLAGGSGPKCSKCHTLLALGVIPKAGECVSCHGKPPNGAPGSALPNIPGAHVKHSNLANVTGVCDSCHNGAGTTTSLHFNGTVDVNFLSAYNAKSGTATYNSATMTCSNVSCHGGITTPPWRTGSIAISTNCISCHSFGRGQFNSYSSGKHYYHRTRSIVIDCTDCHDAAVKLPLKHYVGLNTPQFEGNPADTIRDDVHYDPVQHTCSPTPGHFSIGVCHGNLPSNIQTW